MRVAVPWRHEKVNSAPLGEEPYWRWATVRLTDGVVTAQTVVLNPIRTRRKPRASVGRVLVEQKVDVVVLP